MTKDIEKGYPGQFFDDYLKEQGAYEKTTEQAVKRVLAFQLAEAMEKQGISKSDRYVTKHPEGWAVKAPGAERASSVHGTQREAEAAAKQIVANLGGGEVRIQGRDGKWRDSDTVPPSNDPNPPRDKKH